MRTSEKFSVGALSWLGVSAGLLHFLKTQFFVDMVPAALPAPVSLVYVSGVFEILGGIGLLVPRTRRFSAFGLIALFVAVFPANINMAVNHITPTGTTEMPVWVLWARLPLQGVLIWWAYRVGRSAKARVL